MLALLEDLLEEVHAKDLLEEVHAKDLLEEVHAKDLLEEVHAKDLLEEVYTENLVGENSQGFGWNRDQGCNCPGLMNSFYMYCCLHLFVIYPNPLFTKVSKFVGKYMEELLLKFPFNCATQK